MPKTDTSTMRALLLGVSLGAFSAALACPGAASAQTTAAAAASAGDVEEVVVTATRIQRGGYDAPTPTTVVTGEALALGDQPNIAAVINDLPSSRASISPMTNGTGVTSGTVLADLRGLGQVRTLVLMDGRRFAGAVDLNSVPTLLVKRVDLVTGGASAAWGSGAVSGVVNLVMDDKLSGGVIDANGGISSRDDGQRYGIDGAYGRAFLGGQGHIVVAGGYLKDRGILDKGSSDRPHVDGGLFTTTAGQLLLVENVNSLQATAGGVITSGVLAGQAFNGDGSLSPVPRGSQSNATSTVGGDGRSFVDYGPLSAPYERYNLFSRATYEIGDTKLWVQGSWTRIGADPHVFFGDAANGTATTGLLIQADNAFLSSSIRNTLAAAGQTSFRLGRIFADPGLLYSYKRETLDGAFGVQGSLGGGWTYSAYYNHGEVEYVFEDLKQRVTPNFTNAIDAVRNSSGQIVCRVALANPTTPCRPLNIFGDGNMSPEAIAYAFGDARTDRTLKLDAAAVTVSGDLLSGWAGPVSLVAGLEYRRESLKTTYVDPLSAAGAVAFPVAALNGVIEVSEAFGEIAVPLVNTDAVKFDLNGAARYSDYSTSGGIWSWKAGATARLFSDLLLRGTFSRDIRSPNVTELYATRRVGLRVVTDPTRNNAQVTITNIMGGNADLEPETAKTLAVGGSYAPDVIPGLSVSLDYFRIKIDGAIATIAAQDAIDQCQRGNQIACGTLARDGAGNLTEIFSNSQNLAFYKTTGLDLDVSYVVPADVLGGSLTVRLLGTHVYDVEINDGVRILDRAGDVGDNVSFATPKNRANLSLLYRRGAFGLDTRVRYYSGGKYDSQRAIVNNDIASRTYVDLGARYEIGPATIYANVNNLLDRDSPPMVTWAPIYDVVGRYFSGGVRVKF